MKGATAWEPAGREISSSDISEHDFVQVDNLILRCVGLDDQDRPLGLLRYIRAADGTWSKPPVFAAEAINHPWVGLYQESLRLAHSLMPVLPLTPTRIQQVWHPWTQGARLGSFARASGCIVGLTGSRLLNLHQADSDLDLVLRTDDPTFAGGALLRALATLVDRPIPPSSSFRRLHSLTTSIPRLLERNIYTGKVQFEGRSLKLDLLYCRTASQPVAVITRPVEPVGVTEAFKIVDAAARAYFPGHLLGERPSGERVHLQKGDHLLGYLLDGDHAKVRGQLHTDDEGEQRLVVEEVLAVMLR